MRLFPPTPMPEYELSQTTFFRENGQMHQAGQTVELDEKTAAEYNTKHPGLLKEVRKKAVAHPTVVKTSVIKKITRKK